MRIVMSLGGKALAGLRPDNLGADEEQLANSFANLGVMLRALAPQHELIITHGTPDTGAQPEWPTSRILHTDDPLDMRAAHLQGVVGSLLANELDRGNPGRPTAALLTRVLVDPADPAFSAPSIFVGQGYHEDEARELATRRGWTVAPDGIWWRRVVAAPRPTAILELSAIADLLSAGNTVICSGGGGIPLAREQDGALKPAAAIVDTDLTTALLAIRLRADVMLLLTWVDGVYTDYGTDHAALLPDASAEQLSQSCFAATSMAPKVQAACAFARATGSVARIGALTDLEQILAGCAGTVVRSESGAAAAHDAEIDATWAMLS